MNNLFKSRSKIFKKFITIERIKKCQMNSLKCKTVLLGDAGVGKTSIISSIVTSTFNEGEKATLSASYQIYRQVSETGTFEIQFWDTAGQERFQSLAVMYYRDAPVILIVFSLTSHESFEKLATWVEQVKENTTTDPIIILVGNKVDMENNREIPMEQAEAFAKEHSFPYIEVSAKSGIGIDNLAKQIIHLYTEKRKSLQPVSQEIAVSTPVKNKENENDQCC